VAALPGIDRDHIALHGRSSAGAPWQPRPATCIAHRALRQRAEVAEQAYPWLPSRVSPAAPVRFRRGTRSHARPRAHRR
jgi:hypothetical protein